MGETLNFLTFTANAMWSFEHGSAGMTSVRLILDMIEGRPRADYALKS